MVRFFGSDDCLSCAAQLHVLRKFSIPFHYIDAFADETQDFCDEHEVDELPHLQVLEGARILKEFIGFADPKDILRAMETTDETVSE